MGINVNTICCGLTRTEGLEAIKDVFPEEAIQAVVNTMTPLGRIGWPEDYVGIAVLLASEEGSFITGQSISVDGGSTMP